MGVFTGKAFGIGLTEVNLQDISTSGKSLIIDRGNLEEYKEGLLARFYLQKGQKSSRKYSWLLKGNWLKAFHAVLLDPKKDPYSFAIKRDSKVLISTSSELLRERPLKMRNKHGDFGFSVSGRGWLHRSNQENIPSRLKGRRQTLCGLSRYFWARWN